MHGRPFWYFSVNGFLSMDIIMDIAWIRQPRKEKAIDVLYSLVNFFFDKLFCCDTVQKLSLTFNFTGNLIVILPVITIPPFQNRSSENTRFKNQSSKRVRLKKRSTAIFIPCDWSLFQTYRSLSLDAMPCYRRFGYTSAPSEHMDITVLRLLLLLDSYYRSNIAITILLPLTEPCKVQA